MDVRRATVADREPLLSLIKGYFAFYETPFPGERAVAALLDALAADPQAGIQLVVESAGRLKGFASLYACFDTLVAGRILVMNDLFVEPAWRGRGLGAALLAGSQAYARDAGYRRLDWVTAQDNVAVQRFYDRLGARRGPWVSYSLPI